MKLRNKPNKKIAMKRESEKKSQLIITSNEINIISVIGLNEWGAILLNMTQANVLQLLCGSWWTRAMRATDHLKLFVRFINHIIASERKCDTK